MNFASPLRVHWSHPDPSSTPLFAFREYVNQRRQLRLSTFDDIQEWATSDIEAFAEDFWNFSGVIYSERPKAVGVGLDHLWPPPTWFPGAALNYAENLLAFGLKTKPSSIAVAAYEEGDITGSREPLRLTFRQLEDEVARWAHALKRLGVGVGDPVGVVLPNYIDALLIFLACAACGAVFSSTAPDMGASGIIDRYRQFKPVVFICQTEVTYAGKYIDLQAKMTQVHAQLKEQVAKLSHCVVVRGPLLPGPDVISATDILPGSRPDLKYEQLPFDHPLYVLYSSGTTGPPKCICHAAGRVLLQHRKEHLLHKSLTQGSVYYQYTTTGWMMWNYLVSALAGGTQIVLYDGSPLYPKPSSQLAIVKREHVEDWGTSPKFLESLKATSFAVPPLPQLAVVDVTGSALSAELYDWFYTKFPSRLGLLSGSGGTDLVGGILMPSPMSTIHAGEIAGCALGMKARVFDDDGHDITDSGAKGELVITRPFFSMPLGFLGPTGNQAYEKSYFSKFPGVWCHGDFVRRNPVTGGFEVLGRSDGVLNPGGIRFGSAELYSIIERFPQVQDSVAVGQKLPDLHDEQVLLFVVLRQGRLDSALRDDITAAIRTGLSARHVPSHVIQVKDIPYTTNGKKIEGLVRDVVSGKPVTPSAAVANPESLEEYKKYERLRSRMVKV